MTTMHHHFHDTDRYHLVHGHDTGGQRFYLAGKPVHAGYELELLAGPDTWLLGRYETAKDQVGNILALFIVLLPAMPGATEGSLLELRLPPAACLRWPDEA